MSVRIKARAVLWSTGKSSQCGYGQKQVYKYCTLLRQKPVSQFMRDWWQSCLVNCLLSHTQSLASPKPLCKWQTSGQPPVSGQALSGPWPLLSPPYGLIRPGQTPVFQRSSHPAIFLQAMKHKTKSRLNISELVGLTLILRGRRQNSNSTELRLART